jgi:hypothetical protein
MRARDDRWFKTKCGRDVLLGAIHIRPFDYGFLEGRPEVIRQHVLAKLPETARSLLSGSDAVFVEQLAAPEDEYPQLIYFCELKCFLANNPTADFSFLTAVWFGDDLSQTIPEFLAPRVLQLDWAAHSRDGYW